MSAPARIGVVLPSALPGARTDTVLEWARRVEDGPFATIAVPDRVDYPNWDPLVTLGAVAAVTSRATLMTAAWLGALRAGAVGAKQVATLAQLAPGRLVLGAAVGGRPDDFAAAGADWTRRGALLDDQLELLERMTGPSDPEQDLGPVMPADVPVLIGGASPGAQRRLTRFGSGYMSGGVNPKIFEWELGACRQAWGQAGRQGPMRVVAVTWFCSPARRPQAERAQAAYYAKGGLPPQVSDDLHCSADAVRGAVERFAALGADEVVFGGYVDAVDELDWLADVIASGW